MILTAIVFSSSITIGLLVPLAVARVINLKKAIPFILGANLGTFTDIFLASIFIGQPAAFASAIAYFLFAVMGGLIFLPNTQFLADTVELDEFGFVRVNQHMETSVPGIFAAGDVRNTPLRQIVTAVGDAAIAAFSAEHYITNLIK